MAEKSAHVSLCPAPSSERPRCQWKICPSRASSYLAALFPFHSLPLCFRVPLTTYTNFWPLSPFYIPFPIFKCFHTDRYLLQASCLTQALNPSILGQFLTTLFTSSMKPGNNGALFPLFFILPLPLLLSWHSWHYMVLPKLEIWSLQCLDYPWNDWRRGGSTGSFWLA